MRIVIADDSAIVVSIMQHIFKDDDDITIADVAKNGQVAVELASSIKPDAVIMDINMPVMDGISATEIISKETEVPVLVFSSEIDETTTLKAYQAGAVEVLLKPDIDKLNDDTFIKHFRELILGLQGNHNNPKNIPSPFVKDSHKKIEALVMGASTGGPKTVRKILGELPENFPLGITLVQHLESGFEAGYAQWLDEGTELKVRLFEEGAVLEPGLVLVAPSNIHLKYMGSRLVFDDGPRVQNQKPAVDILFQSAADIYGSSLLGVLLTGMGRDGADGCSHIIENGGTTVVQDAATSDIFGMPKAAIEQGAATYVEGLDHISHRIIEICSVGRNG